MRLENKKYFVIVDENGEVVQVMQKRALAIAKVDMRNLANTVEGVEYSLVECRLRPVNLFTSEVPS